MESLYSALILRIAAGYLLFKSQFEVIKSARKYADMKEQVTDLVVLIGLDSVRIYNQFTFNENQENPKKTLAICH